LAGNKKKKKTIKISVVSEDTNEKLHNLFDLSDGIGSLAFKVSQNVLIVQQIVLLFRARKYRPQLRQHGIANLNKKTKNKSLINLQTKNNGWTHNAAQLRWNSIFLEQRNHVLRPTRELHWLLTKIDNTTPSLSYSSHAIWIVHLHQTWKIASAVLIPIYQSILCGWGTEYRGMSNKRK
jgi:hypothetical protein